MCIGWLGSLKHGTQRRMISLVNFFVFLRLLFFALLLLYVALRSQAYLPIYFDFHFPLSPQNFPKISHKSISKKMLA